MASNELKDPYTEVTAMVIAWQPIGDYDRRVVLLTREMGKISAFARGARRPGSSLLATTDIFCFGTFRLYAGRNSYTIQEAAITNYFEYFRTHLDSSLIGQYFLEVMEYCTRENNDEASLLLLLYQSLRALASPAYSDHLVISIFEIRTVVEEGELPEEYQPGNMDPAQYSPAVVRAMETIVTVPVAKLYTFRLDEASNQQLSRIADRCMNLCFDHHSFRSREVLRTMGI